jgi:hypothetical protein
LKRGKEKQSQFQKIQLLIMRETEVQEGRGHKEAAKNGKQLKQHHCNEKWEGRQQYSKSFFFHPTLTKNKLTTRKVEQEAATTIVVADRFTH